MNGFRESFGNPFHREREFEAAQRPFDAILFAGFHDDSHPRNWWCAVVSGEEEHRGRASGEASRARARRKERTNDRLFLTKRARSSVRARDRDGECPKLSWCQWTRPCEESDEASSAYTHYRGLVFPMEPRLISWLCESSRWRATALRFSPWRASCFLERFFKINNFYRKKRKLKYRGKARKSIFISLKWKGALIFQSKVFSIVVKRNRNIEEMLRNEFSYQIGEISLNYFK